MKTEQLSALYQSTPVGKQLLAGRIDGIKSNLDSLQWWIEHAERMRAAGLSCKNSDGAICDAILRIQKWANRLADD